MGFWSRLFGRNKAVETVESPVVATPTPPVEVTPTIAEVEAQVEALLREMFPGAIETFEAEKQTDAEALEEKKRKRSEAAKKAAATRAANKAKKK